MEDKILSFLGICRRAGRLVIGADSSIDSIHKNKAKLIIFAIGKLCGVLAVQDNGFANKLNRLIEREQGGELYEKI